MLVDIVLVLEKRAEEEDGVEDDDEDEYEEVLRRSARKGRKMTNAFLGRSIVGDRG